MKSLKGVFVAVALMLSSIGVAQADTITLNPAGGFGALHQYHGVTTSAVPDDPVTLYLPQGSMSGGMSLYFNSQVNPLNNSFYSYWLGTYKPGYPATLQECVFPQNVSYYAPCVFNGQTLTVTITDSVRTVRGSGSGRGGYSSHQVWTLLSGVIVR